MDKKRAIFLIVAVGVTAALVASVLTSYFTAKRLKSSEIYVEKAQYEMILDYYTVQDIGNLINQYYYRDVKLNELTTGAMEGSLRALGDGYSMYYPEQVFQHIEDSYIAQGMLLVEDKDTGYCRVSKVFADTPADEGGVLQGELVTAVGGVSTTQMDLAAAVARLRGQDGTTVDVTLFSDNDTRTITITRNSQNLQVVFTDMLDGGIGYIDIVEFSQSSVSDFKKALASLTEEGAKGIIIDLRENPGGYLSQATEMADMLIETGLITYSIDKANYKNEWKADSSSDWKGKVAVLADNGTAGAAEIFAGALKDSGRAQIVGQKTAGKGAALTLLQLPNSLDGIRLVSGYYYTPNGNEIEGNGIAPDREVVQEGAAADISADQQLQAAIAIIQE